MKRCNLLSDLQLTLQRISSLPCTDPNASTGALIFPLPGMYVGLHAFSYRSLLATDATRSRVSQLLPEDYSYSPCGQTTNGSRAVAPDRGSACLTTA
jgi:hypothetical protein